MYDEKSAYSEETTQEGTSQETKPEVEVEPVKFSKKKVWLILMVLLVLVLLVLLVISQTSLTKSTKNQGSSSESSQVESSVDLEVSSKSDESQSNLNESNPYIEESSSAPSGESNEPVQSESSSEADNLVKITTWCTGWKKGSTYKIVGCWVDNTTGELTGDILLLYEGTAPESGVLEYTISDKEGCLLAQGVLTEDGKWASGDDILKAFFVKEPEPSEIPTYKPEEVQTDTNNGLVEVQEPVMNAEISTSGIVAGRSMYQIGNSYTYGINIVLVTGNDQKVECQYFCPKNTYNALGIGDALVVTYQTDSQGNVSISSISK